MEQRYCKCGLPCDEYGVHARPCLDHRIEWHRDPAASGPRVRAQLELGEILVYDDGRWYVTLHGKWEADGRGLVRDDSEMAKKRALVVYEALTRDLTVT